MVTKGRERMVMIPADDLAQLLAAGRSIIERGLPPEGTIRGDWERGWDHSMGVDRERLQVAVEHQSAVARITGG